MQVAALIGALVAIAGLTGALVYVVSRLSAAHKAERTATGEQARLQRELFESQAREGVMQNTEHDFRVAHQQLSDEYAAKVGELSRERARAERAERQRDDLIRQLAARQDPAALVASINDELAALARAKGQGR